MENTLAPELTRLISDYGYYVIFLFTFLECSLFIGVFFPGSTLLVLSGLFAATGELSLSTLWLVAFIGAYFGDLVGYTIGYIFGEKVVHSLGKKFGYDDTKFEKVRSFFTKWGAFAILVGRYLSIIRALLPATVGTVKYRIPKFLLYDAIGTFLWCTTYIFIGYFFGENWHIFQTYFIPISTVGFILGFLIVYLIFRSKKNHD